MSDEPKLPDPADEWGPEVMLDVLRRQIRELEAEKIKIKALHHSDPEAAGRPLSADDNDHLRDVLLELQALRKMAEKIES